MRRVPGRSTPVCLAIVALLIFAPAPAFALDAVERDPFVGQTLAGGGGGCESGANFVVDEDNTAEGNTGPFSLTSSGGTTGTCPNGQTPDPSDTYSISGSGSGSAQGQVTESPTSLFVSAQTTGAGAWSQTQTYENQRGNGRGEGFVYMYFDVLQPVAYSISGAVGSAADENDGATATVEVELELDGTSVPGAHAVITRVPDGVLQNVPTVSQSGMLEPGRYQFRVFSYCGAQSRRFSEGACGVNASGTLRLGGSAPSVFIDEGPSGPGNPATASFAFHSDRPEASFQCKLDTAAYASCTSPHTVENLATGSHTFTVIAIDGLDESEPESRTWEVGAFDCSSAIVIGFARACGVSLAETAAGSKIYKTSDKAWVGGFELRPRPGGKLVVDVPAVKLRSEGAGVDVVFAGFVVPYAIEDIPIASSVGELDFNQAGTLEKQLFKLPIAGKAKVGWGDVGSSATFEAEIELEKLTGAFATFSGIDSGTAKLTARLRNGVGFELTGAELNVSELTATPKNLQTPRKLKLKSVLFKYQLIGGKHAWEGGATIAFPVSKSMLELTGRASVLDGSLTGGSIKVAGLNKPIPDTPLFLQAVEGSLVFNPKWGFDLGAEATLGPAVADKKLIEFSGNIRGGALTSGCTSAPDPAEITLKGKIPALADLSAGKAEVEGTSCLSSTSAAMETRLKIKAELGDTDYDALVSLEGQLSGWISLDGVSMEGTSRLRLPALPEVAGTNLVSTRGIAACGSLGWFEGGVAYPWLGVPQAFTGCDLAPWRVAPAASGASASAAGGRSVRLAAGLPFAGFSARGAKGVPRLRVTGPGGRTFTAPSGGRGKISSSVVFAPMPTERRMYVFVRRPAAGRWRVTAVGSAISGIRSARGLPDPNIKVKVQRVKGSKSKRRLEYRIRPIAGQKVRFYDRADNLATPIGRTTSRRRGSITFTPGASLDRSHVIEAVVTSGRFPRDTLTAAKFTTP